MLMKNIKKNPLKTVLVLALIIIIIIGVFSPRMNRLTAGLNIGGHLGRLRGSLKFETFENCNLDEWNDKPCVGLIHAKWCGHCQKLEPEWIAAKNKVGLKNIIEIDEAKSKELLKKYSRKIQGFPTIIFFKNGLNDVKEAVVQNVDRTRDSLVKMFNKLLKKN